MSWFHVDGLVLIFCDAVSVCEEDVESDRVSPIHQRLRWSSCRNSLAVDGAWGRGAGMVSSCVLLACVS